MKKHILLITAILLGASLNSYSQDVNDVEDFQDKKNHFYLSIELLKTIPWLMIDNAYIIEPSIFT